MSTPTPTPKTDQATDPLLVVTRIVEAMPRSGRYGTGNVFISEILDRAKRQLGMTLLEFKRYLIEQNRLQGIVLMRADLVDDMDPRKVENSEIEHLGATFHFVVDRSARERESSIWPKQEAEARGERGKMEKVEKKPKLVLDQEVLAYVADPGEIVASRDQSQPRVAGPGGLFWPGGSGGGGSRRRKGGGAVVRPHAKTSPGCRLCQRLHTTAEHARHGGSIAGAKKKATRKKATKKKAVAKRKAKATAKKAKTKTAKTKTAKTRKARAGTAPITRATTSGSASTVSGVTPAALLRVVRDAIPRVGPGGKYGSSKVFISELWRAVKNDPLVQGQDLSLDRFKRWLLAANRDRDLNLARADLVGAMDPGLVTESEIQDRGAAFHFVLDPSGPGW